VPGLSRSAAVCYAAVMAAVFGHITLVADPPDEPAISNFKDVVSSASGRFLPATALAAAIYHCVVQETQREKMRNWRLWTAWVAGLWSGAVCNVLERHLSDLRMVEAQVAALVVACLTVWFVGKHVAFNFVGLIS
jgi:hypothetical protein